MADFLVGTAKLEPPTYEIDTSGNRQLPSHIGRLLDRIKKAMEVNSGIECRQAALPGVDCLSEQGIQLPDIERISAGKVVRHVHETLGYGQVLQLVACLCTLHAQHLAALG